MLIHSFSSISVRILLLALVISHLHAKPDDDQDGPSTNGNINNTQHSSILSMNQAGRFPSTQQQQQAFGNNNNSPFTRFQQQQQQQQLGFSPNTFPNGFGLQQQNTGFPQQQQSGLFFNNNPNGFINPGQQQFGSTSGLNNQQFIGNTRPQFGGLQSPFLNQNQLLGLSSSQLSNEQFGTNGQLIGGFPNQQFGGFQQQQNPFNLGFRNQFGNNPSQFGVSGFQLSQLGGQNQIPIGFQTASGTGQQNNLLAALQNNQLTSQPNPFLQNQFIGFNNQPDNFQQQSGLPFFGQQSGFSNQNPFGLLTNSNSPFIRGALSTGPSSSIIPLSSNQILIPGGRFQDDPSSLIGTGSTRFLLNNNNNRFNNGPTVAASQFNSQFADNNNNNQKLDQRPFRFTTPSATDRSLTFDNNSTNFQSINPFLAANNNFQGSPFIQQQPNNFQGLPFNGNNLQQFQQQQQPIPIPNMDFSCDGRLSGYYADMKTGCRTFHICRDDGTNSGSKNSFACPNGTLFSQFRTMCINELEVDCSKSQVFYPQLNNRPFPTASPFNTQIPSPLGNNNNNINTTPSSSSSTGSQQVMNNNQNPIFNVGLPSPSMGSLDFGRSLRDTSGKVVKQDGGNNNLPLPFRPSLFRPSLQVNSDPL